MALLMVLLMHLLVLVGDRPMVFVGTALQVAVLLPAVLLHHVVLQHILVLALVGDWLLPLIEAGCGC
jgi:hypothetical protein